MALISSNGSYMSVTDYRDLMKGLRKIEPTLVKAVRKDIRKAASPLRDSVKNAIPASRPIYGMESRIGRLSWGAGKPARSVVIDTRAPRVKPGSIVGSLVKLVAGSPATVLADMAGRSGRYVNARPYAKGTKKNSMLVTKGKYKGELGYAYTYRDGVRGRVHKINSQGRKLIAGLGGNASRYAWPAAERGLPAAKMEVKKILEQAYDIINRDLRTK